MLINKRNLDEIIQINYSNRAGIGLPLEIRSASNHIGHIYQIHLSRLKVRDSIFSWCRVLIAVGTYCW